jgi:hypothetical protein
MKKFLFKIALFSILLSLLIAIGLIMPTTPRASTALIFGSIKKDSLLVSTSYPRMIFVGGSSLSFGLNSQMIKDSLNVNPINTGLTAGLGLKYMLDNTLHYLKKGDIIILAPEYAHFVSKYNDCSETLLRMVMDVHREKFNLLNIQQMINLIPHVPKYVFTKFKPTEYFGFNRNSNEKDAAYRVTAFNQYGDTDAHWGMEKQKNIETVVALGELNRQIIAKIKEFEQNIEKKGATLYLSYPGFQDKSFYKSAEKISDIQEELEKNFKVLGNPVRYMMPDSLMFDTPYHLNKQGIDRRTKLLIEDIKDVIKIF